MQGCLLLTLVCSFSPGTAVALDASRTVDHSGAFGPFGGAGPVGLGPIASAEAVAAGQAVGGEADRVGSAGSQSVAVTSGALEAADRNKTAVPPNTASPVDALEAAALVASKAAGDLSSAGEDFEVSVGALGELVFERSNRRTHGARGEVKDPASVVSSSTENATLESATVVASWLLFHVAGNRSVVVKEPLLSPVVLGIRDPLAHALQVCRSAVSIMDMHATNLLLYEKDSYVNPPPPQIWNSGLLRSEETNTDASMRVTQIRVGYEIRICSALGTSLAQVSDQIDELQYPSRFHSLSRQLASSLSQSDHGAMEEIVLDDLGYSERRSVQRPRVIDADVDDCRQEVLLYEAKLVHQNVVFLCFVLVALITCAGASVFGVKQPSIVPSRFNPLASTV